MQSEDEETEYWDAEPQTAVQWLDQDPGRAHVVEDAYWAMRSVVIRAGYGGDVMDALGLSEFMRIAFQYSSSCPANERPAGS